MRNRASAFPVQTSWVIILLLFISINGAGRNGAFADVKKFLKLLGARNVASTWELNSLTRRKAEKWRGKKEDKCKTLFRDDEPGQIIVCITVVE